MGILTVYQFYY